MALLTINKLQIEFQLLFENVISVFFWLDGLHNIVII